MSHESFLDAITAIRSLMVSLFLSQYGELAQLGERLLCTQEVSGSIPLFSTNACPIEESMEQQTNG